MHHVIKTKVGGVVRESRPGQPFKNVPDDCVIASFPTKKELDKTLRRAERARDRILVALGVGGLEDDQVEEMQAALDKVKAKILRVAGNLESFVNPETYLSGGKMTAKNKYTPKPVDEAAEAAATAGAKAIVDDMMALDGTSTGLTVAKVNDKINTVIKYLQG